MISDSRQCQKCLHAQCLQAAMSNNGCQLQGWTTSTKAQKASPEEEDQAAEQAGADGGVVVVRHAHRAACSRRRRLARVLLRGC